MRPPARDAWRRNGDIRTHMKRIILAIAGLATLALSVPVQEAQAQYRPQYREPWHRNDPDPRSARNVPGEFDYYALVLSWSPTYCSTSGDRNDMQCNRQDGKRYAFVLHGLWPQYQNGYPESCRTHRRPFVPQPLIDSMLDIMPSPSLVIHEYRKHGTCSGLSPDAYFGLSRRLFERIRIPERYRNPFDTQHVAPEQLIREFVRINPELNSDMIAVACGGSGNRLREIRICYSREGRPTSCGRNENQRRLCRSNQMFVPPVRSTAREDDVGRKPADPNDEYRTRLPRPRVIEMFKSD